jgi:hypothetical protein
MDSSTTVNTADTHRKRTFTASHVPGELYVPTMQYRFKPSNPYSLSSEPLLNCSATTDARKKEVKWTFFYPTNKTTNIHQNTTSSNDKEYTNSSSFPRRPRRRLLIALTSGYDKYATMLTHTAHAALLYAFRQNQQQRQQQPQGRSSSNTTTTTTNLNVTVVILQGMAFHPHDDIACATPPMYASLNKIRLLFYAIDHSREYDYLLLLDADALLVDLDYDITQLLSEEYDAENVEQNVTHLLAAQPYRDTNVRVQNDDDDNSSADDDSQQQEEPATPRINSGITLWNLHHEQIKPVAISWFQESKNAALKGNYQGDQRYLQMALTSTVLDDDTTTTSSSLVRPTLQEFNYRDGSVGQHFIQRGKIDTWKDRLDQLIDTYQQHLCKKYDCSQVPRMEFPTQ